MAWTIDYTETAKKQLRKLDKQTARRILDFMDERIAAQADPRATGKALTGLMLGAYWRYRVGDYRILCDIQDGALRVLVIEIGNRRDIYR
ncbi:type II toxin-antitoxin system RelE family toxin [Andreprevotia chitinilytica]|uniref:type II toxin-antitoxin system RelE family toxin n=1 Tax=Andreprevotia chitinilytica TaxID=396808 RepID=UPI00054DF50E|nr:type II toxin-antitoxin system RelE/ParE family toxin [Andreprevotia chitinilytica]